MFNEGGEYYDKTRWGRVHSFLKIC